MRIPSKNHVVAFAAALTLTSILASLCSTQFVLGGLATLGVDISLPTRITMSIDDFRILQSLLPAVAAGWLLGFPVAGALAGRLGGNRKLWFAAAGGIALLAELLIMQAVLGVTVIAGARSLTGLICQGLAGAAGGYLFASMTGLAHAKEARDA